MPCDRMSGCRTLSCSGFEHPSVDARIFLACQGPAEISFHPVLAVLGEQAGMAIEFQRFADGLGEGAD